MDKTDIGFVDVLWLRWQMFYEETINAQQEPPLWGNWAKSLALFVEMLDKPSLSVVCKSIICVHLSL